MFTYYKNPKTEELIIFDQEERVIFIAKEIDVIKHGEEEKEEEVEEKPEPKPKPIIKKRDGRGKKALSPKIIERIKEMTEQEISVKQIAKGLGIKEATVYKYRGRKKPKITLEIINKIKVARINGETNKSKVARDLGVSEGTVRYYWEPKEEEKKKETPKKESPKFEKVKVTQDIIDEIQKLKWGGMDREGVSSEMKIPLGTVKKYWDVSKLREPPPVNV